MDELFFYILFLLLIKAYARFFKLDLSGRHILFVSLVFYLPVFLFVAQNMLPVYTLISAYCALLCLQDHQTMYIDWHWKGLSILLIAMCAAFAPAGYRLQGCLLFSLPAFFMHRYFGWNGSADGWFLLLFGWILGLERMLICMLATLVCAFLYLAFTRKKQLPFLSFLSIGFLASLLRGYAIYATMFL
jgi:hypothetical protein